jgi:hypothetical protein
MGAVLTKADSLHQEDAARKVVSAVAGEAAVRQAEPAGKTLMDIFATYSASAVIEERIIRGEQALGSARRIAMTRRSGGGGGARRAGASGEEAAAVAKDGDKGGGVVASELRIDEAAVRALVGKWAFDAFAFEHNPAAGGAPLVATALAVLDHPAYGIFGACAIPRAKLLAFLADVENSYFDFACVL